MLKSALILGAALAAAGSASSDSPRGAPGAFVLFSGGIPTVQINTGRGALCPFEAPSAARTKRGKPVFAAY